MLDNATDQLNLFEGRRRADRGMALAADASDPVEMKRARDHAIEVAKRIRFFIPPDVRKNFSVNIKPNAWGSIWKALRGEGVIKFSDLPPRSSELPGQHAHTYRVYESLIYGKL